MAAGAHEGGALVGVHQRHVQAHGEQVRPVRVTPVILDGGLVAPREALVVAAEEAEAVPLLSLLLERQQPSSTTAGELKSHHVPLGRQRQRIATSNGGHGLAAKALAAKSRHVTSPQSWRLAEDNRSKDTLVSWLRLRSEIRLPLDGEKPSSEEGGGSGRPFFFGRGLKGQPDELAALVALDLELGHLGAEGPTNPPCRAWPAPRRPPHRAAG